MFCLFLSKCALSRVPVLVAASHQTLTLPGGMSTYRVLSISKGNFTTYGRWASRRGLGRISPAAVSRPGVFARRGYEVAAVVGVPLLVLTIAYPRTLPAPPSDAREEVEVRSVVGAESRKGGESERCGGEGRGRPGA